MKSNSDKKLISIIEEYRNKTNNTPAKRAFAELYDRYSTKVNAYLQSLLKNEEQANDIFQETFIKFYEKCAVKEKSFSVIAYLITIARNLSYNFFRDTKTTVSIDEIQFPSEYENDYENKEMNEFLIMALDLIDNDFKEVLVLRYFNGMRYKEIAEIMNITDARARYLAFTGKQKVREVLSPYFKDVFK